jgi:hypothetical protein
MKTYFTRPLLSLLFLLLIHKVNAQEFESFKTGKLYLKLNVVRVVPTFLKEIYVLDRGLFIEPALKIGLSNRIFMNAVFGYSKVGRNPLYENFDYTSEGSHLKFGFELLLVRLMKPEADRGFGLSAGLNGTYAKFNESGTAVVKGNYFGNLETAFAQSNLEAISMEPNFNIWFVISKRFTLVSQIRLNIVTSQSAGEQFPSYYIPGIGAISPYNETTDKTTIGFGSSVQLFYKLF